MGIKPLEDGASARVYPFQRGRHGNPVSYPNSVALAWILNCHWLKWNLRPQE